ncbi:MAG: hypothetical protein JOZ77_00695 [Candidatus Eremiobacteraeota bacterium]|nr:hypothetical protein [Candidatus Eremiobacteraeota bacterium]
MKLLFGRAIPVVAVISMLSACSGLQGQGMEPRAGFRARVLTSHGVKSRSWMLPEARAEDLIYVVGGCGGSCVLSYPKGKLVGTIEGYHGVFSAACSDAIGNVFISNNAAVVEFAHAGTTPIATFSLPGDNAEGCSVDRTTGSLAVVFGITEVAIFTPSSGAPAIYNSTLEANYCGYDDAGNLFVDGSNGQAPGLAELPKGGQTFLKLSISQSVGVAGQVQWDGSHITYESGGRSNNNKISQLQISGSMATVVGTTSLQGIRRNALQSWIYEGTVVVPYGNHGPYAKNVGIWQYPNGGRPTRRITKFGNFSKKTIGFFGATVSVAR